MSRSLIAGFVILSASQDLLSQSLSSRIAAVRDGAVTFHYTARPGVCGDGEHYVKLGGSAYYGSFDVRREHAPCEFGPVQVRVTMDGGDIARVQYWVGAPRSREAQDLGEVPAPEAARWLMSVAQTGSARASAKAIMPAVLADSSIVWPTLLAIAKDVDTRSRGTRMEALLWLSRFAGSAVEGRKNDPLDEDERSMSDDDDLKRQAVFVLSQLPHNEGVPELLKVSQSPNISPRVKRQAFFWLGQSGDSRAIELFETVLR